MSQFKVEFDTDNAAFADDDGPTEVAVILRHIANVVESGTRDEGVVRDVFGNTVGEWKWDRDA